MSREWRKMKKNNTSETMEMSNETPHSTHQELVDDDEKIDYKGIKAMPFIIGNETFEKLGAIGTLSNLQVYLTTVFNMQRISATTLLNGTTNIATLLGAYLSDTYFGLFKTLGFASVASLLGMLVITLTSAFKNLHPPHCPPNAARCVSPDAGQFAFLVFGFAVMVIGAGGIRPCNLAFGADQFDPETESGKRGINSFFNWYYFTITFAQIVSVTFVVYVQSDVSWSIGLAIPMTCMFISCLLYFVGVQLYVKVRPQGSPITSLVRVFVVAAKKRKLDLPQRPWNDLFNYMPKKYINSKLPYTEQFRFLDKAAIITTEDQLDPDGSPSNPWNLCTMQQVEEAKCALRVVPVSLTSIFYHIGAQQQYIVFQALQSNRHLGKSEFQIPAASYVIFAMLSLTMWVPIYDRFIVPWLRKITKREGGITLLQRMGIGLFLTIVESVTAGIVEKRRRDLALKLSPRGRGLASPMSAMWLVPQLVIGGLAEAFNAIGQIEFYYKQFPENMRSIAGGFFFCGSAVSSSAFSLLISIIHKTTENGSKKGNWLPEDLNEGRLDSFYYLVAALCALNFSYFLVCARWYRYKGGGDSDVGVAVEEKKNGERLA